MTQEAFQLARFAFRNSHYPAEVCQRNTGPDVEHYTIIQRDKSDVTTGLKFPATLPSRDPYDVIITVCPRIHLKLSANKKMVFGNVGVTVLADNIDPTFIC